MPQGIEPLGIEIQTPTLISPFYELPILMDWFDDFVPSSSAIQGEEIHSIKIEEFAKDNEITIRAELPGVDPEEDIEVTVGNGYLTIKGERREEHTDAERSDFHYGSFIRSVALPRGIDDTNVHATYKDDILEVKVQCPPSPNKMKRVSVN